MRASFPGRSGGGAGKGRRAYNYEYQHRKRRREILIGGDDISNDVITLGTCSSMLFYIRTLFHFALIGGKSDSSVDGEPQGNWRWNSNSRGVIASSPFFSAPPTERPGELARRLIRLQYIGPGSAVS